MHPKQIALHYDQIADFWRKNTPQTYGVNQLRKAIQFATHRNSALDIGCGSQGRFIKILNDSGFHVEGLDSSAQMIALSKEQYPEITYYHADICNWSFPKKYDLISAWDSTFHLPLDQQAPVLQKMCRGLNAKGVLLFTCGGLDSADEITGTFENLEFGYSSLGLPIYLDLLRENGCICKHLEYDQYPESHVYIVSQKSE